MSTAPPLLDTNASAVLLDHVFDTYRHVAARLLREKSRKFKAQLNVLGFAADTIQGHDWSNIDLRDEDLTQLDFTGCNLLRSDFDGADVEGCFFTASKASSGFLNNALNTDKAFYALPKPIVERGRQDASEPRFERSSIMVMGIGGAGGNAVDNFIEANTDDLTADEGVRVAAANTDAQALRRSKVAERIQLGLDATAGLGAGARPEIGAAAARESQNELRQALSGVDVLFLAAGMGGGSGSGATPVVAAIARELGITVIAVVSLPFEFEGSHRAQVARQALDTLRSEIDAIIVLPNQNLFRIATPQTTFAEAFRMADTGLEICVATIVRALTSDSSLRMRSQDLTRLFRGGAMLYVGQGLGEGPTRCSDAVEGALSNPLLTVDPKALTGQPIFLHVQAARPVSMLELDRVAIALRRQLSGRFRVFFATSTNHLMNAELSVEMITLEAPPSVAGDNTISI